MSINGILNTGLKGVTASQLATSTTASNVSNAATVGYTRRVVSINLDDALSGGQSAKRVVEPFIQKRLLNANSGDGEASAAQSSVSVLDKVFAEGDGSLGSALDAFQVSVQALTSNPADTAARQQLLSTGANLASAFQNSAAAIKTARTDAAQQITASVEQVNQRLGQIGKLGVQIQQSELNGTEASDLRDQRDQLLSEVSQRVPITTLDQGNGQLTVLLAGSQQLVGIDGTVSPLTAAAGDDGNMKIQKASSGATIDVTSLVSSGSIGGQMKASKGVLTQAQQKLDQLAYDVATSYNQVHSAGFAPDGTSGRDLFTQPTSVAGAAENFSVSSDVADSPENIATASSGTAPDNGVALAMANIALAPLSSGGMTVSEALASLVGYAGSSIQDANQNASFASGALQQVQSLYDTTSGVSSEEEMVSLMKYQQAYQASLKVLQTADQMFASLLAIKN